MPEIFKYDMRGAQFAGGFAETVQGNQTGGIINNYTVDFDKIEPLLAALRKQAEEFPQKEREEAVILINGLEEDLKKPETSPKNISEYLKKLLAVVAAVGAFTAGATTFSDNLNKFTNNVVELTNTLCLPLQEVSPENE